MRTEVLKQLLDACHLAKKSIETMPKLPKGMKPRHVHVMDVIGEMEERGRLWQRRIKRKHHLHKVLSLA